LINKAVISDIFYAYQQLFTPQADDTNSIFKGMDLKHIGIFGHSLGGYEIVKILHRNSQKILFQAALAMDAPSLPRTPDITDGFSIPFMHLHGAEWDKRWGNNLGPFTLATNGYFAVLAPNAQDNNYTSHNNFYDYSTLQYLPALAAANTYLSIPGTTSGLDVGKVYGYTAVQLVNDYIAGFFDTFLKKEPDPIFTNCKALPNTMMKCGK
jgi:hypothetical protein